MWAGNEELDSPCHSSLPDPADRDDWRNKNPQDTGDGNQTNEDWIWFTESQLILQGPIDYTLNMSQSGSGNIIPDVGPHIYADGQVVELNAEPASGWEFAGWTGSGTPAILNPGSPNTTITMDGDYSITANFQENAWSPWIYDTNPENGKIEYSEMIAALMDYLAEGISFSQMIDVLMCYLTS